MSAVSNDIRLAIRLYRKQPGFFLVALFTLTLGIGGSTAIFSVIDAALVRPLPYPDPERIVGVLMELHLPGGRVVPVGPSLEDVRAWEAHKQVFSNLGLLRTS